MTTDLEKLFQSAQSLDTWSDEDVLDALSRLAGAEFRIDWEPGDEAWGRIVDGEGNVQALVCARMPVGIVHETMNTTRMIERVSWMSVSSMSEPMFCADRRLLERLFGRTLSENIDYSRLSINDLWWATV